MPSPTLERSAGSSASYPALFLLSSWTRDGRPSHRRTITALLGSCFWKRCTIYCWGSTTHLLSISSLLFRYRIKCTRQLVKQSLKQNRGPAFLASNEVSGKTPSLTSPTRPSRIWHVGINHPKSLPTFWSTIMNRISERNSSTLTCLFSPQGEGGTSVKRLCPSYQLWQAAAASNSCLLTPSIQIDCPLVSSAGMFAPCCDTSWETSARGPSWLRRS